jgi:hypothetical protein
MTIKMKQWSLLAFELIGLILSSPYIEKGYGDIILHISIDKALILS